LACSQTGLSVLSDSKPFSVLFLSKTMAMTEEAMSWLQANNLADLSASLAKPGLLTFTPSTQSERYGHLNCCSEQSY
jgi:hypothetical protein